MLIAPGRSYKEVFFRGGDRVSSRVLVGYAEVCDSWLDPEPDRPLNERCEDLYHRVDPSGAYIRELRDGLQCLFNPTRRLAQTRDDPLERIESTGRCGELSLLSEILAASWVSTPLPPEYEQVSQQTQILLLKSHEDMANPNPTRSSEATGGKL